MSVRRIRSSIVTLLLLLACISLPVYANEDTTRYSFGHFYYHSHNGYVSICGYLGRETDVEIPSVMSGRPVSEIESGAFDGCDTIETITVPDTVVMVYGDSFTGASSLKTIISDTVGVEILADSGVTIEYRNQKKEPSEDKSSSSEKVEQPEAPAPSNNSSQKETLTSSSGSAQKETTASASNSSRTEAQTPSNGSIQTEANISSGKFNQTDNQEKQNTLSSDTNKGNEDASGIGEYTWVIDEKNDREMEQKNKKENEIDEKNKKETDKETDKTTENATDMETSQESFKGTSDQTKDTKISDSEKTETGAEEETKSQTVSEENQEKQENSAPASDHTGMLLAVLAGVIIVAVAGIVFWKKRRQY